jgi:hypothetical protein
VRDGQGAGLASAEPIEDAPADPVRERRSLPPALRATLIHLTVLACYLAAGVAVNWTRARYLVEHVLPGGRDTGLYVWDFWWMAHSVTHLSDPYFSRYQAAPVGVPLAFHTLMPLPGALLTPVTLAYGAAFTLNLVAAAAPGLTCYAMYRVARLWLPSQTGAIAAGAFFGLSTIVTWNDWTEAQIAVGQIFLPLALEAAVRLGRRPSGPRAFGLGLVMGAALLTDQESAILAGLLAVLALLPWLARTPGRGGDRVLTKLWSVVIAGVTFVLVASPQIVAMLNATRAGDAAVSPASLARDDANSGAALQQIFAPSPRLAFFGGKGVAHYYYQSGSVSLTLVAYGTGLTILALFGLAVCWRRRGVRPLALLWVGATLLAMGTAFGINRGTWYVPLATVWHGVRVSMIMPYTWLVRFPVLSSFREANRITELGLVPVALLAAAGVDWMRRNAPSFVLVAIVLTVFEAGSAGASATPMIPMPAGLPALDRAIAADHSHSIVVDIPFGVRSAVPLANEGAAFNDEAQVLAAADGHPTTVAYVSRLPDSVVNAVLAHPFYHYLMSLQHRYDKAFTAALFGYRDRGSPEIAAAAADARRMDVGWAIVWIPTKGILHYLQAIGFKYEYQADGALLYRLPPLPAHAAPG